MEFVERAGDKFRHLGGADDGVARRFPGPHEVAGAISLPQDVTNGVCLS